MGKRQSSERCEVASKHKRKKTSTTANSPSSSISHQLPLVTKENIVEVFRKSCPSDIPLVNFINKLMHNLLEETMPNKENVPFYFRSCKALKTYVHFENMNVNVVVNIMSFIPEEDLLIHPPYQVFTQWFYLRNCRSLWRRIAEYLTPLGFCKFGKCKDRRWRYYCREKLKAFRLHQKCGPLTYMYVKIARNSPYDEYNEYDEYDSDDYEPITTLKTKTFQIGEVNLQSDLFFTL